MHWSASVLSALRDKLGQPANNVDFQVLMTAVWLTHPQHLFTSAAQMTVPVFEHAA